MTNLVSWAIKNGVSHQALEELREMFGTVPVHVPQSTVEHSEAWVQQRVRVYEAPHKSVRLYRNNVGVAMDKQCSKCGHKPQMQPVRYGLANDSKRLNDACKSGDLIGWRSLIVTAEMVGTRLAQFVSRECKRPGWKYSGDEHEKAQLKWAEVVNADGGDARFASGEGTL